MNTSTRLDRALHEQAEAIGLAPADAAVVMRRGAARRTRRRAGVAGLAVAALVATSLTVVDRGHGGTDVSSDLAASVVPSSYDWTVVEPGTGLGYSSRVAELDGALYRLSTAPGAAGVDGVDLGNRLYRSDDGAEWQVVELPDGLRASSLAAAGGTLYALGTAPGGGGRDLVVAASADGAATWQTVTLPRDVAELEARFGDQIHITAPRIATRDGTHLVATVVVGAEPDVEELLPGLADPDAGWSTSPEGVTLYRLVPCEADDCDDIAVAKDQTASGRAGELETVVSTLEPAGTYTWDELGLDPELQELVGGRTLVYVSDDGTTFERVELPAGSHGWASQLVASAEGYHLVVGSWAPDARSTARVLRSADGRSWEDAGTLSGAPTTAGLLGGHPAVALYTDDGRVTVQVARPDGTWVPLELATAVAAGDDAAHVLDVAFGPLGVAATVMLGEQRGDLYLVHSEDGSALSAVRLADHLGASFGGTLGIDVSADAITVRVGDPADGDPSTVPTQRVLVGTPR